MLTWVVAWKQDGKTTGNSQAYDLAQYLLKIKCECQERWIQLCVGMSGSDSLLSACIVSSLYACIVAMSNKTISLVSVTVWITSLVLIRFGFPVDSDSLRVTLVVLIRFGSPQLWTHRIFWTLSSGWTNLTSKGSEEIWIFGALCLYWCDVRPHIYLILVSGDVFLERMFSGRLVFWGRKFSADWFSGREVFGWYEKHWICFGERGECRKCIESFRNGF